MYWVGGGRTAPLLLSARPHLPTRKGLYENIMSRARAIAVPDVIFCSPHISFPLTNGNLFSAFSSPASPSANPGSAYPSGPGCVSCTRYPPSTFPHPASLPLNKPPFTRSRRMDRISGGVRLHQIIPGLLMLLGSRWGAGRLTTPLVPSSLMRFH